MNNNPINNNKFHYEDHVQSGTKKINKDSSLEDVAQEFESLFVYEMLKNARRSKLADNILTNKGVETYQSMIDEEFSKIIAKGQNFGVAEALVRQFGKNWSKD
tara:strand:+ start:333 stop:641 length:309 start_codon:yes stop_codon:yes gene_type:complete